MKINTMLTLLAAGAVSLNGTTPLRTPPVTEAADPGTYQQPQGLAAFFLDQGELLDFDPTGSAVTVNDCIAEFAEDWRRAADSAIDSVRAYADMLSDGQAPAIKIQLWRNFVDLAVALDGIATDLEDGSADDAAPFAAAADAYTDFGSMMPTLAGTLAAAAPAFNAAAEAMESLALHVQNGSTGAAGVAFLDELVLFHESQLAIAAQLFDQTSAFADPGPGGAASHAVLGTAQIEESTDILLGASAWSAYGIGYQVGTNFDAATTFWIREEQWLRTTMHKSVAAGYTSAWNRFLGLGAVAFSTTTTTTSSTITLLSTDPTVGTLP